MGELWRGDALIRQNMAMGDSKGIAHRRFALLRFLHDDAAEAIRKNNLAFHGNEILHRN